MSTNTTCVSNSNEGLNLSVLKNPQAQKDLLTIFGPVFMKLKNDIKETLDNVQKQITQRDEKIKELEETVELLKINELNNTQKLDNLEQELKLKNLIIHGLPSREEQETPEIVVDSLKKHLNIDIKETDIEESFRLGKPDNTSSHRPVLIKFTNKTVRNLIYKTKSKLKDSKKRIYINEDFTKKNSALFRKTRQLKKEGKIANTWTKNGIVFYIHYDQESPETIRNESDLNMIKECVSDTN